VEKNDLLIAVIVFGLTWAGIVRAEDQPMAQQIKPTILLVHGERFKWKRTGLDQPAIVRNRRQAVTARSLCVSRHWPDCCPSAIAMQRQERANSGRFPVRGGRGQIDPKLTLGDRSASRLRALRWPSTRMLLATQSTSPQHAMLSRTDGSAICGWVIEDSCCDWQLRQRRHRRSVSARSRSDSVDAHGVRSAHCLHTAQKRTNRRSSGEGRSLRSGLCSPRNTAAHTSRYVG
jgi:hypothetical protein